METGSLFFTRRNRVFDALFPFRLRLGILSYWNSERSCAESELSTSKISLNFFQLSSTFVLFKSLVPPTNEFQVGEKLETVDPRNQDSWCIGTIQEIDGPRLKIRLDGTDDRNDFWRLVDSAEIRAHGATERFVRETTNISLLDWNKVFLSFQGGQIVPPLGFQLNSTRWARYFDKNVKQGPFAADSCFKTVCYRIHSGNPVEIFFFDFWKPATTETREKLLQKRSKARSRRSKASRIDLSSHSEQCNAWRSSNRHLAGRMELIE